MQSHGFAEVSDDQANAANGWPSAALVQHQSAERKTPMNMNKKRKILTVVALAVFAVIIFFASFDYDRADIKPFNL
jgi:hypothetical protein